MRLLHPQTIVTIATSNELDFTKSTVTRKTALSHSWSECLKFLATRQQHPKMFLDDYELGFYMKALHIYATMKGCNLNSEHVEKYKYVSEGFNSENKVRDIFYILEEKFGELYLMSDCVSFHLKGLNLGEVVYGKAKWRRICPIESLAEIVRVTTKAIEKGKVKI